MTFKMPNDAVVGDHIVHVEPRLRVFGLRRDFAVQVLWRQQEAIGGHVMQLRSLKLEGYCCQSQVDAMRVATIEGLMRGGLTAAKERMDEFK